MQPNPGAVDLRLLSGLRIRRRHRGRLPPCRHRVLIPPLTVGPQPATATSATSRCTSSTAEVRVSPARSNGTAFVGTRRIPAGD